MFSKTKYKANRKAGKRGQEYPELKITPAGETVKYTTREGKKAEYLNASGQHMVLGMGIVNRKQARKGLPKRKDTSSDTKRAEARAAKHAKRNAGEHARAVKTGGF